MNTTRRSFLNTAAALAAAAPLAGWSQSAAKLTLQAAWVNDAECWRRRECDPGCRFLVTHPLGRKPHVVPRLQPLCTGSVNVGSVGQKVVGRNTYRDRTA